MAGVPDRTVTGDTARIFRPEAEAPVARAPEREESIGSRLYRIAAPMVGHAEAERVKQFAALLDETPAVADAVGQLWERMQSQQPSNRPSSGVRASTIAIVILATTLAAVLVVVGVAAVLWANNLEDDVLSRSRHQDAEIATLRLESTKEAAKTTGRQDAQDKQAAAMQARLDAHDQQIDEQAKQFTTLTKHVISRMDAIGEKTGANRLDSWTETPASLRIVALQDAANKE
jgi:hypothetical protein